MQTQLLVQDPQSRNAYNAKSYLAQRARVGVKLVSIGRDLTPRPYVLPANRQVFAAGLQDGP
jgi:hypothetical protein